MPKKPLVLEEVNWIKDVNIRVQVERILDKYPDYLKQPASISGKYHKGENRAMHVRMALVILKHICTEFNITGMRRDKLFAAMILHDIGCVRFMRPGRVPGWKYYEVTGWSRKSGTIDEHPLDGFQIIMEETNIHPEDIKIEIANMVLKHMSHWYKGSPNPETEDERWIAISDYIASREDIKFVGLEVEDWTK
jgi:hypothetical protein